MPTSARNVLATAFLLVTLSLAGCAATATQAPAGTPPAAAVSAAGGGPTSVAPARTPPASAAPVEMLPAALRQRMTGVSWRAGCPVGLDDLRLLHVPYVDFDGHEQVGLLVVNRAIADATLRAFAKVHAARFPIRSMRTIEDFAGSDDDSMAADNTSAFNCRNVPNTTHWSNHAYGRAVDLNTVENPYLPGRQIMPPAGKDYVNRADVRRGMIVAGDPVVAAFGAEGFTWGGTWKSGTDYQHFEKPA